MSPHDLGSSYRSGQTQPLALVGIGCRLPGDIYNIHDYWSLLKSKRCGIRVVPDDRWNSGNFYDENPNMISTAVSKWGGFLGDIRSFDPGYFELSPREAAAMDPQQRLVLQTTVEAMEDAGIPLEVFRTRRTGVFVGIQQSDYRIVQERRKTGGDSYGGTNVALCIVANRVSHRLDLHGPSIALDTACSSSLNALNQAVLSLRSGGCEMAVVSGINLIVAPTTYVAFSQAGMLSNTGVVSTFDANANGFVRGEGVSTVILKPLDRAVADGDRVHAVVLESHANQDGYTSTITAPNQSAQKQLLQELLERSGLTPDHIGFVEAHGTGTPIGDPIEAGAIGSVLGRQKGNGPLYVGSGKPNIGHLESGAGAAGLVKLALALKHGEIPPNINFKSPNARIPFDALNIEVPTEPTPYPDVDGVRYGIVNSFGFGGANSCALLASYAAPSHEGAYRKPSDASKEGPGFLFPVSARSLSALKGMAGRLRSALGKRGALAETPLATLSTALGTRRSHHAHRAVVRAGSRAALISALRKIENGDFDADCIFYGNAARRQKLCFMFAGQGSQWWGMARDLLREDPDFRAAVDAYDADFQIAAGWSIKDELLRDKAASRIDDTTVTQPALFAIQVGLAALWAKRGVLPDMVVGHSIGEAAAAYLAGGLSLRGAAQFLSKRGAIRDRLDAKGAMAAVGMPAADVEATLPEHGLVEIAAINGPGLVTVSGDYDKIHEYVEEFSLAHPNTFIRILKVDTAWHSYQLDAGEAWFRDQVTSLDCSQMRLPFISTVTGKTETRFDLDYAWSNLRQPVRFQAGIVSALNMNATVFLELGPHTTLSGPATSTAAELGRQATVLSSLNRKRNDFDAITDATAALLVAGIDIDWEALNGVPAQHVDLPTYAWDNEELWVEPEEWRDDVQMKDRHPFLGMNAEGAGRSWMSEINLRAYPYLSDHRLQSDCIFPGAGYMETILSAARRHLGEGVIEITEMKIHEALFVPQDEDVRIWTQYNPTRGQIQIFSHLRGSSDGWVLRAEGLVRINDVAPAKAPAIEDLIENLNAHTTDKLYAATAEDGIINYGRSFRTVKKFWAAGDRSAALIRLAPEAEPGFESYLTHPTTLDGCFQVSDPRIKEVAYILDQEEEVRETFMPIGARRVRMFAPMPRECYAICTYREWADAHTAQNDCTVVDLEGNVVLEMTGLLARQLETSAARQHPEGFAPHFAVETFDRYRPAQGDGSAQSKQRWLVIGGDTPGANAVADGLVARGASVVRQALVQTSHDELTGLFADLLDDLISGDGLDGIVYAGALDAPEIDEETDAATVGAFVTEQCSALIALGAAFDEVRQEAELPRLALVTKAGRPAPQEADVTVNGALQAPLSALFRTLTNETPEIDAYQYDVDASVLTAPDRLIDLLLEPGEEFEVVLRETGDLVPRLKRVWADQLPAISKKVPADDVEVNFEVTMETPGVIDNLEIVEIPLAPLGRDEIRVKVAAVGLNFRDVMAVTALLPREAEAEPAWRNLGLEFSGEVVAVGENCTRLKPGDRVMGLTKRCLQRFISVAEASVVVVPEHVSMEEAATIPSAFATAYYALVEIGRLKPGDKALIHVATGGVGQAALQIAQGIGAEMFATAGSPEKRELLRSMGVAHVMNSRDLAFADEVMHVTGGRGVDVVLNSLPGAYIEKGIDILAPYGRFLEIGKRDVYEDSAIGLKALRKNISLSVLDLAAMGAERPDLLGALFRDLVGKFEAKELVPLPFTAFPVSETAGAFRYMSQAKHVGKVVVTFDEAMVEVKADRTRAIAMSSEGTYLVTGGNGGFGLSIADWMSRIGAGRLCLASRSGKVSEEDEARIAAIRARGTEVDFVALDVADAEAVDTLIKALTADQIHPLKGVLHAAALIKDGFIIQLTSEMIADVLRPKVMGMWNLHQALRRHGSEAFLMSFSSVAALIGSAGQANYVAANAFLDAMSAVRSQAGDPAGSVQWGAIAATGMVARNEALQNYLESIGLKGLHEDEAPAAVEALLRTSAPTIFYANADWRQIARANPKLGATPRVSGMLAKAGNETSDVRARLMTLEGEELLSEIVDFVKGELHGVLNVDPSEIDAERPIAELGLDSLSSFELKMRMETALGLTLQVSKFLQAPTTIGLARLAAEELEAAKADASSAADDGDASGGEAPVAAEAGPALSLSDRGAGLLRESVAPHSSASTIAAFECRRQFWCSAAPDLAALKRAAQRLTKRHPLLRVRPSGFDTGAALSFDGAGLKVVAAASIVQSAPPLLDVAEGEFAVLTVAPSQEGGSDWLLQVHRAIADDESMTVIASDLASLLAGASLPRVVAKRKLFDLLSSCRYDPEALRCENDRAFWYYSIGQSPRTVEIAERGKALPTTLGRDHGAAEEYVASTKVARSEPEVAAAFAEAVRAAAGHDEDILVSRRASIRHRLPDGPAVGPFETEQPLLLGSAQDDNGWLQRTLETAADHDRFDMYAVRGAFADQFEETGLCPVQLGFRYAPSEALHVQVGDLQLVERPMTSTAIAHDIELIATPGAGEMTIRLRTDASVVSRSMAARLIAALEARLECSFDKDWLSLPVEAAQ